MNILTKEVEKIAKENNEVNKKVNQKEENDKRSREIIDDFFNESEKTGSFINQRWTKEMLEPKSMVTGKDYKGYNVLYLATRMANNDFDDNRFFTVDHLKDVLQKKTDLFLKIKKGETGTSVKYFRPTDAEEYYRNKLNSEKDENNKEKLKNILNKVIERNEAGGNREKIIFSGYHNVFSGSQIENFDKAFPLPEKEITNKDLNKDKYISYLIKAIKETGDNVEFITKKDYKTIYGSIGEYGAYNAKGTMNVLNEDGNIETKDINRIVLPPREDFKTDKHYLATLLHERGHSLENREEVEKKIKKLGLNKEKANAMEEVQAELTAGMTMIRLGIDTKSDKAEENIFGANKDYIQGWCTTLKECNNIKSVFESLSEESMRRSNYLVDKVKEYEKEYPFEKFLEETKEVEEQKLSKEEITKQEKEEIQEEKKEKSHKLERDISKKIEVPNEYSEVFKITQKKMEKFIKENLHFNVETVEVMSQNLKEMAKEIMIRDLETEKDTSNKFQKATDEEVLNEVKHLKTRYNYGDKKAKPNDIFLTEKGIECLVKTVKDYSNERIEMNLPTLIVTNEQVNNYYTERTMDKEIDLDYENLKDDDFDEKFEEEYELYEEEYSEILEEKAKAIVSKLVTSNKSFDMIENEINEKNSKMACVKLSGTENMLPLEKTARDIGYIITCVEKYDFDRSRNFIKEVDIKEVSEKTLSFLKTNNVKLQEELQDLDYNSSVDLISKKREELKEKVDTYIEETTDKIIKDIYEKFEKVVLENHKDEIQKTKNIDEKTDNKEIEILM